MSIYQRTTRECSLQEITPELRQALQAYFQSHYLGNLETEALISCETISEKKPGGWIPDWLDPKTDESVRTCIVLTGRSLIWARKGDLPNINVAGAELENIVARLSVSLFSKNLGLDIFGQIEGSRGNIHGVIALGPEPDSQKFCDQVFKAVNKINPPPARKWPRWMGRTKE